MSSRSLRTCSTAPKTTNNHRQPCQGAIQRWDNVVGVVGVADVVDVVGVVGVVDVVDFVGVVGVGNDQ